VDGKFQALSVWHLPSTLNLVVEYDYGNSHVYRKGIYFINLYP